MKTTKGHGRLSLKVKIPFYSKKYGQFFSSFENFKKFDNYKKRMWVFGTHKKYKVNQKEYSTPELRKRFERHEFENKFRKAERG